MIKPAQYMHVARLQTFLSEVDGKTSIPKLSKNW